MSNFKSFYPKYFAITRKLSTIGSRMLLAIAIVLTCLLALVVVYDVTKFIIPNWVNLAFILIYPLYLIFSPEPVEWWMSLLTFACFFAGGLILFQFGIIGGGDIKLLIVLSLWIGWHPQNLMLFGFWTAMSGGVLSVFLLVIRWYLVSVGSKMKKIPDYPKLLRSGEPIPYGLAISYAFGYLLWTEKLFKFL